MSEHFLELTQQGFVTALRMALPVMLMAFLVGAIMGTLQTIFQIQDTMISSVPKVVAVLLLVGVALPWMLELLGELFQQCYSQVPFGTL